MATTLEQPTTSSKLGYKKTDLGWIPEDWSIFRLNELGALKNGINKEKEDFGHGHPFVNLMDVFGKNKLYAEEFALVDVSEREILDYSLVEGDVLFIRSSVKPEGVGLTAVVFDNIPAVYSGFLIRYRPQEGIFSKNYLQHCFYEEGFRKRLLKKSTISANTNINQNSLKSLVLALPPIEEQEEIARILSTWDEAIAKTEALIASKTQLKKALMHRLLTGQLRFGEFVNELDYIDTQYGKFPRDWKKSKIKTFAQEVSTKNTASDDLTVLSCTKYKGLVNSLEYFGKQIFSEDTSTYKIVQQGQFAYATNHIEEGSIGYLEHISMGLVSPMYTVFETDGTVNNQFLYKLLKTDLLVHIYQTNTSASVDRRGSLRWNEFSKIELYLPSLPEQIKIASVLNTADEELTLLNQQLEALKLQKKGLMQQLLTGKKRVKGV